MCSVPSSQAASKELTIQIVREPAHTHMTPRKRDVCLMFGIPPCPTAATIVDGLTVSLRPGSITYITGPSGSGKSSTLRRIAEETADAIIVGQGRFPRDRAIVDAVAPRRPLRSAMEILCACGLSEPAAWIRRFDELSEGEKMRAALARAIGIAVSASASRPILCDEFAAALHDRLAATLAHNLRRLATRFNLTLVLAGTRDAIRSHLHADRVIRLGGEAPILEERTPGSEPPPRLDDPCIEPGCIRDYHAFARMHYRMQDALGFVDRVFTLCDRPRGDRIGVCVLAHAPRELALRNIATRGRFNGDPRRLNRELRIIRRLVIHPDFRSCGLGHWFVRQILPQAGVRFVECLAVMGAVIPVFEKAGMTRVGQCPLPRGRLALVDRMLSLGLDPASPDFSSRIKRNPRVRALVERTLVEWLSRMQSASRWRLDNRSAEELSDAFRRAIGRPPVYYLWDREGEFPVICLNHGGLSHELSGTTASCEERSRERERERQRHDPNAPEKHKSARRERELRRPDRQSGP